MTPRAHALAARPVAAAWVASAWAGLQRHLAARLLRADADPVVVSALATNFSVEPRARALGATAWIALGFAQIARVLAADDLLLDVADAEAAALFPPGTPLPPAYALHATGVYLTSAFLRFGPKCRAAMLVHEAFHVIDPASGAAPVHVSEWDEPRFSQQSVAESLHNPSAFASFAAQVHEGALAWPVGARYGAGRPDD